MGLTRIRAEQISDIDYKQAVRVVTTTPVTLAGGAPSQVDTVNLNAGDRILVTGQGTASQNGLYDVQSVGSGSNGTWVRTSDANTTGEISAGMVVMVTEGTNYADTMWKLITNDPITVNTTDLVFVPNPSTSFTTIQANGTAVIANAASSTLTLTPSNNIVITGNNASDTVTIGMTNTPSFTGNITSGSINVTGDISLTGNLTIGANLNVVNVNEFVGASGNISFLGNLLPATLGAFDLGLPSLPWDNLYVTTFTTATNLNTGNLTANNVINTSGIVSATGNITGGNIITTGQASISGFTISANTITAQGPTLTIDPNGAGGTDGLVVIAGNLQVQGNATYINSNNITTNDLTINMANNAATASAANGGGIEVGPAGAPYVTLTYASSPNIWVASNGLSVTGNISGNYFIGNGSQLTGLPAGYANSNAVAYGEAGWAGNIIPSANATYTLGNATNTWKSLYVSGNTIYIGGVALGATANSLTFAGNNVVTANATGTSSTTGNVAITGNVSAGNILYSAGQVSGTGSIYATAFIGSLTGTASSAVGAATATSATTAATVTTAAQPNITSVGTLSSVYVSSTISVGGGIVNTGGNGVSNIGATGAYFNTVFAKATSAVYADLAEMYCADAPYAPGTVVEFGGSTEVQQTTQSHSVAVAGIVSTNPSYLMNSTLDCVNALEIALVGRVPCQVVGQISKGDRIVSSHIPGVGTKLDMSKYEPGCIIGKALEDYNSTEVGTIEVAVGRI